MQLDEQQKREFVSYWGRCPLLGPKNEVYSIDHVDIVGGEAHWIGHKFIVDGAPLESSVPGVNAQYRVRTARVSGKKLEQFEPIFLEPGYYQWGTSSAVWVSKKPERSMVKGMSHVNTDIFTLKIDFRRPDIIVIGNRHDVDIRQVARVRANKLPSFTMPEETIQQAFDRHREFNYTSSFVGVPDISCCLSRNVALVSSDIGVPVVMYKTTPVGFYLDDRIHIDKTKDISKELIEEETSIAVETYED